MRSALSIRTATDLHGVIPFRVEQRPVGKRCFAFAACVRLCSSGFSPETTATSMKGPR